MRDPSNLYFTVLEGVAIAAFESSVRATAVRSNTGRSMAPAWNDLSESTRNYWRARAKELAAE